MGQTLVIGPVGLWTLLRDYGPSCGINSEKESSRAKNPIFIYAHDSLCIHVENYCVKKRVLQKGLNGYHNDYV